MYLKHAAEIWSASPNAGPTGRFAEVLEGEVQDYGRNILFAGTADDCVAAHFKIATRLVPTGWAEVDDEVAGADFLWQPVLEQK